MDKLVDYFISETNKKFEEVKDDLKSLQHSVSKLHEFKTEIKTEARVSARTTSLLIGGISVVINIVLHFL